MDFKKLFHKTLRPTKYIKLADVYEMLFGELRTQKFNRLENKYIVDKSETANLQDLLQREGFPVIQYNGETSTDQHLKRRNKEYPIERLFRGGLKSYIRIMKSFWLKGGVFPLNQTDIGNLLPNRDPLGSVIEESSNRTFLSDREVPLIYYYDPDTLLPVPNPPIPAESTVALYSDSQTFPDVDPRKIKFLDTQFLRGLTNHFLLEYYFLVLEAEDLWMSSGTAHALFDTIEESKRLKQVAHFQPRVNIDLTTGSTSIVEYKTVDELITSYQVSWHVSGDLTAITKVQLGKGRNYSASGGCAIQLTEYDPITSYFNILEQTGSVLFAEYLTYEYSRLEGGSSGAVTGDTEFYEFSEIAFLDQYNTLIAYSRFPTINLHPQMYDSMSFRVTLS